MNRREAIVTAVGALLAPKPTPVSVSLVNLDYATVSFIDLAFIEGGVRYFYDSRIQQCSQ